MLAINLRNRMLAVLLLFAATAIAQDLKNQPTVWASQPDIAAFNKMENDRLAAAQRAIDEITAVKGAEDDREHPRALRRGCAAVEHRDLLFYADAAGASRFRLPRRCNRHDHQGQQRAVRAVAQSRRVRSVKQPRCLQGRRGHALLCAATVAGISPGGCGQGRCHAQEAQPVERSAYR